MIKIMQLKQKYRTDNFEHSPGIIKFFRRIEYLFACTFYYLKRLLILCLKIADEVLSRFEEKKNKASVQVLSYEKGKQTVVDDYWDEHTVLIHDYKSVIMSKKNLAWRFKWYPKFQELMELYGDHRGETILDYGCGPGNDIVGFALYSRAKKIIGVDVSYKALKYASKRLQIHPDINPKRIELIRISDAKPKIPLKSKSVDYIYSEGVIHHTSNPLEILRELHRVLRPGGHACIMVYNYQSIFVHLYLAYETIIVQKKFPGFNILQVFTKSTDGINCPISRCYKEEEFVILGKKAGFKCEFKGGYLSGTELNCIKKYFKQALNDKCLGKEHRDFLKKLNWKENLPLYEGKYAGIGGVYKFYKK